MKFSVSAAATGAFDTAVRILPAGAPVSFADSALQAAWAAVFSGDELTLTHQQVISLRIPFDGRFITVLLAGFDSTAAEAREDWRGLIAALGEALLKHKARSVMVDHLDALTFLSEWEAMAQLAANLPLCEYKFETYLTKKSDPADLDVTVLTDGDDSALREGHILAEAVMTARDLVNDIAEVLTPAEMARRCTELGGQYGFQVEVLDQEQCQELDMNLFLAVARGSVHEPKFIVMRWSGGAEDQPPIALVGKGITYDSGGLAIKTGGSMTSMRFDMNGGASVIGAMCAISRMKLPCNVVAVVAACENMVDAKSYRNGDIFRSMNGQTVYVQNTDAEGRLTMADAITYCVRKTNPSEIIEVAGLTGSVCNFYGTVCAAALTRRQEMFDRLCAQTGKTGEKFAQMPTFPEYRKLLNSPFADLNNAPAGGPGGILAGLFLDAFAEDVPFLHIDYGAMPFTGAKGGTGFGVRSLYHYVKSRVE